jgi:hypothetical protein
MKDLENKSPLGKAVDKLIAILNSYAVHQVKNKLNPVTENELRRCIEKVKELNK